MRFKWIQSPVLNALIRNGGVYVLRPRNELAEESGL